MFKPNIKTNTDREIHNFINSVDTFPIKSASIHEMKYLFKALKMKKSSAFNLRADLSRINFHTESLADFVEISENNHSEM